MKNNKILYYFVICFLFFISYSNCQPMEDPETARDRHLSSSPRGFENDNNLSEVAALLAHVQCDEDSKKSTETKLAGLAIIPLALASSTIVMVSFAYLTGYLFHDGISPVIDNSTCSYNTTYAPPLFATQNPSSLDQNHTAIALDVLRTGGLAFVPAVASCVSALFGGGSWLVDKGRSVQQGFRSVQQGFRNRLWSDQKVLQVEDNNPTIQARSKSKNKKNCCCLPEKFLTPGYHINSRPVEVVNGLFWGEFYFNFIATALIANYPNNPVLGQVYGYLFGAIGAIFAYHLYTHVTGEADKRSFHRQDNQDNAQYFVLALLKKIERWELADQFMFSKNIEQFRTIDDHYILAKAWHNVISGIQDFYFEQVKDAEQRKRNIFRIFSFITQGVHLPLKVFAQYMLARKFCWALGASPDRALIIAASITAALSPFLGFGSLREKSLIQYELYQIHEFFSRPRSWYTMAMRGCTVVAALATIFYWATPTWYAYQREILYDIYCHQYLSYLYLNDLRVRAPLAALFSIPAWCVGRQFFQHQFNQIIDTIASKNYRPVIAEERTSLLHEQETRELERLFLRISYLLRKNQYNLEKKSYELDEAMALTS